MKGMIYIPGRGIYIRKYSPPRGAKKGKKGKGGRKKGKREEKREKGRGEGKRGQKGKEIRGWENVERRKGIKGMN